MFKTNIGYTRHSSKKNKAKNTTQKTKKMNNTGPIKTGGEPRCSQILGVSVSCKSKTNFRALKDNWLVIWLKQSNFISNAGSLLRPDQEEFETTGIYYIACPVVLIYIALKHFIWNYSRQAKYNSTTVHTRNTTKERKRHPKHKMNNQEKGIKHYPYFHSQ
jgi:hypothetical protein